MSQLERLYWIDSQIRSRQFPNADTVVQQFGVSRRTAFADRDCLKESLHAPLAFDTQRGGWTYTDPSYVLPLLTLTAQEASSLHRTLLAAQEYLGAAEAEPLRLLRERLAVYLPSLRPNPISPHESVQGAVHPACGLSTAQDLLQACHQAIQERQRLRLLYHSVGRDAVQERTVQPYHLLNWRGEDYLIAWCEWRKDWRQFFLGRVREWSLLATSHAFTPHPDFDVAAYLGRGLDLMHGPEMVRVQVRFSAYQARWVRERRYHESQETQELVDGSLLLTLRVAGTAEVRRWLLGYGAEVEVLEPTILREEMATEAKKVAKLYGT